MDDFRLEGLMNAAADVATPGTGFAKWCSMKTISTNP
jgi:hypothetical protein